MGGLTASTIVAWAASRWQSEVANRPLQNVHRRTLDETWRQVIRHFGGDDAALCGPSHEELTRLWFGSNQPPDNLHSAVRNLLSYLTPDVVLTFNGAELNHSRVNEAVQRVKKALD